jgi:hypothetical protein
MKGTLDVLRELDGKVHVVITRTLSQEPVVIRQWFPTGIRADMARASVGEFEGRELKFLGSGIFETLPPAGRYNEGGKIQIVLESGSGTEAVRSDQFEAEKPKTRRRGKIYWQMGEWWISGPHGNEILSAVDLRTYAMM